MVFSSSILTGADICHIETLTITNTNIIFKRRKDIFGLFSTTITIPRNQIHRITVVSNILGSDFNIYCYGDTAVRNVVIHGIGFNKHDVNKIIHTLI